MWWPGRHRLSYPQAWPEDRRHVTTNRREIASAVRAQAIRWSSSRDVYPKATPVDNVDDCLATPQTAHARSDHVCCIVYKVSLMYTYRTVAAWTKLIPIFNVKRSIANVSPILAYGSWQLTDRITCCTRQGFFLSRDAMLVRYSLNSTGPVSSYHCQPTRPRCPISS